MSTTISGSTGITTQDITVDGVYVGGTGSANYLTDYEEGTWTPSSPSSGTMTNATGGYVKVGQLVFIQWYFAISGASTTAGLLIDGLPFTPTGESSLTGVEHTGIAWGGDGFYLVYALDGLTNLQFEVQRELVGSFDGTDTIRGSMTFRTAD